MKKKEDELQKVLKASSDFRKTTVSELCHKHLDADLAKKDLLKPKAADRRESTIRNQIDKYPISRRRVTDIIAKDIEDHIESLIAEGRLSVSSIDKAFDVINAAYNWAMDNGYLASNPCKSIKDDLKKRLNDLNKRNSADGVVHVLSDNQIRMLEDHANSLAGSNLIHARIFALSVLLLLYTGMRVGELCALRWHCYSPSSSTLKITKTRNISKNRNSKGAGDVYVANENIVKNCHCRTIMLSDEAKQVIEEIRQITPKKDKDDYIVVNTRNNPSNPSNYGDKIDALYAKLGFPKEISGAHILRRTRATRMYEETGNILAIAAYLGDLPQTIEKHYISTTKEIVSDGETLNVVCLPAKKK